MRTVRDAPGSSIGLAWVTDRYDDLTEEFIGIVRGRTAGLEPRPRRPAPRTAAPKAKKPQPPRTYTSKPRATTKAKPKPRRPR